MDWQGRKHDKAKPSLCYQILSNIVLVTLMRSLMTALWDDQTRSDLSCFPASEENISVNAYFKAFSMENSQIHLSGND